MVNMEITKDDDLDLSYLLNVLDGTLSQQDMVYVITTNHLDKLDPALYRKGRINVIIDFKKCDHYQILCISEKIMKRKIDETVLAMIAENTYTPADIIQHLLENIHNNDMTDKEIMEYFIPQRYFE
jgi:chaperone BCS1